MIHIIFLPILSHFKQFQFFFFFIYQVSLLHPIFYISGTMNKIMCEVYYIVIVHGAIYTAAYGFNYHFGAINLTIHAQIVYVQVVFQVRIDARYITLIYLILCSTTGQMLSCVLQVPAYTFAIQTSFPVRILQRANTLNCTYYTAHARTRHTYG